jgi:succinate-semialdehyde dehydrogenase / glutarate-semialdehyde dehydrogenase
VSAERIRSLNPATAEVIADFDPLGEAGIEAALTRAASAQREWRTVTMPERAAVLGRVAASLRREKARLGALATLEMGKPIAEAEGEVEKCAWVCDYYADHGAQFLASLPVSTGASQSYVEFVPLGTLLAIMPWNFPYWQVMRCAAPALMAGNAVLLKHAPNVPQCALAIERLMVESRLPEGVFQTVLLTADRVAGMIADARVAAVTLTGSEKAGSAVGAAAGRSIKKCVMELGGSDAFIVLADADLATAVETAVRARFQNCGQSCIAAKRFLVEESVFERFADALVAAVGGLRVGDPSERATQIGPMARADLRDHLTAQVHRLRTGGGRVIIGGAPRPGRGFFFAPTVVSGAAVAPLVAGEEVFGPVAVLIPVRDAGDAVRVANQSPFGLGCSLWTSDLDRARQLAPQIEAGAVFVNGMVASDPRLPFGGVKRSGFGRELSEFGVREFVNVQTVWIGPQQV